MHRAPSRSITLEKKKKDSRGNTTIGRCDNHTLYTLSNFVFRTNSLESIILQLLFQLEALKWLREPCIT